MRALVNNLAAKAYLFVIAMCAALCMLGMTVPANAVFLTPLDKTPSQVKVCPEASCPAMAQHPFRSGTRVVIYETKNGWARVTKLIARENIAAQFPGQFLPNEVAMWIPVKDLPEIATSSPSIKQAIDEEAEQEAKRLAEEERKKKARQFSFIPKRPAIPTPRSERVEVAAVETQKPEAAETPETTEPSVTEPEVTKTKTDETETATLTNTDQKPEAEVKTEVNEETEVEAAGTSTEAPAIGEDQQEVREAVPITEKEETGPEPAGKEIEVAAVEPEIVKQTEAEQPKGEPALNAPIPTRAVREGANETSVVKEETQPQAEQETAKLEDPKPEEDIKTTEAEPAVEAKVEEEVETDSFGNPIISVPKKLTKELRDKRLSKLPSKPNAQLDLKSIIAMRHHGLQLIKNGECSGIAEGGRSLSLAGWIYLRCDNDPNFRQYSVE